MKWTTPIITVILCSFGCGEQKPRVETKYDFYDNLTDSRPEDSNGTDKNRNKDENKDDSREKQKKETEASDSGVQQPLSDPILADEAMELEELEMEDSDALTALISARLSSTKKKRIPRYGVI
ncbi:MAG: hypothetical protein GY762_18800 [Proteobacteria bacterium]|nr:hypothetical protein [Pseudomonadota bacterium]